MKFYIRKITSVISNAHIARHSAALAFYAIYALAPMVIIFVSVGGLIVGEGLAEEQIIFYFQERLGESVIPLFENIFESIKQSEAHLFFSFIGLLIMIYGLSHFFSTLREAFFSIFGIHFGIAKNLPKTFLNFLKSVGYAFALAVLIFFLLLINAAIPLFWGVFGLGIFRFLSSIPYIDFFLAFILTVLLLAFTYRFVSAFSVGWKHAFFGSFLAATLFTILNILLALYFNLFHSAHAIYGASASLVAFLLWVYYSTKILLIGALATRVSDEV